MRNDPRFEQGSFSPGRLYASLWGSSSLGCVDHGHGTSRGHEGSRQLIQGIFSKIFKQHSSGLWTFLGTGDAQLEKKLLKILDYGE